MCSAASQSERQARSSPPPAPASTHTKTAAHSLIAGCFCWVPRVELLDGGHPRLHTSSHASSSLPIPIPCRPRDDARRAAIRIGLTGHTAAHGGPSAGALDINPALFCRCFCYLGRISVGSLIVVAAAEPPRRTQSTRPVRSRSCSPFPARLSPFSILHPPISPPLHSTRTTSHPANPGGRLPTPGDTTLRISPRARAPLSRRQRPLRVPLHPLRPPPPGNMLDTTRLHHGRTQDATRGL